MAIRYTKVWKNGVSHGETLHDILNGIRVVKSYGNEVKGDTALHRMFRTLGEKLCSCGNDVVSHHSCLRIYPHHW